MTISSEQSPEATPLFPLPGISAGQTMELYGTFSTDELRVIIQGNIHTGHPDSPANHLLALQEQDELHLLERFESPVKDERVVAYQTAVCMGRTMISRWARKSGATAELDNLVVNPNRVYLKYGDMSADTASWRSIYWPRLADDFTQQMHYAPFFQDASTETYLGRLRKQLEEHDVAFMRGSDRQKRDAFAYLCRGLIDTLQLYQIVSNESRVAPATDTVFDPEKHQLLNDRYAPPPAGISDSDLSRRWRMGGLDRRADDGLPLAYRGVAGYVDQDGLRVPVFFKSSREELELAPGDMVLAHDRSMNDLSDFDWQNYPFTAHSSFVGDVIRSKKRPADYHPIVILRGNNLHYLREPYFGPECTRNERFFYRANDYLFGLAITGMHMEQDRLRG